MTRAPHSPERAEVKNAAREAVARDECRKSFVETFYVFG
jgi:hypothetical protein